MAVYFLFFKLLGLLLFLIEIAWFVARPVYRELVIWHSRRNEIAKSRRVIGSVSLIGALVAGLIPWNLNVTAEAWAHARRSHTFYSPLPGQLATAPVNSMPHPVKEGSDVFVLDHPESEYRAKAAMAGAKAIELQLAGLGGLPDGEQKRPLLQQLHASRHAEVMAQLDESKRLRLTAPFDGVLLDLDPLVRPGVWMSPQQPLATLIDPKDWQAEALVGQSDLARISIGNHVLFYPEDNKLFPIRGTVSSIESARILSLSTPLLSSRHGGSVAVLPDSAGLTPRDPLFRVRIDLDGSIDRYAVRRGSVLIDARAQSWLISAFETIAAVLIRESGF